MPLNGKQGTLDAFGPDFHRRHNGKIERTSRRT